MSKLKIKNNHYCVISGRVHTYIRHNREAVESLAKTVSNKRLCWDVAKAAFNSIDPDIQFHDYVCDTLYAYLDDTHIDNALKDIVSKAL